MIILQRTPYGTGMIRRWEASLSVLELRDSDLWVINHDTALMLLPPKKRMTRDGAALRLRAGRATSK